MTNKKFHPAAFTNTFGPRTGRAVARARLVVVCWLGDIAAVGGLKICHVGKRGRDTVSDAVRGEASAGCMDDWGEHACSRAVFWLPPSGPPSARPASADLQNSHLARWVEGSLATSVPALAPAWEPLSGTFPSGDSIEGRAAQHAGTQARPRSGPRRGAVACTTWESRLRPRPRPRHGRTRGRGGSAAQHTIVRQTGR